MKGYTQVSLPKELHKKIEEFISENPELGYKTIAEFVKDAIRRLFESKKMQMSEDFKKLYDDMKRIQRERDTK